MSQRKRLFRIAIVTMALSLTGTMVTKANAQFSSPIIHDPTNGIQLIESVRESIEKIASQIMQLDQIRKTIQSIVHLNMPGIGKGFGDINSALGDVSSQSKDLSKYPIEFAEQLSNLKMVELDKEASKAVRDFAEKIKDATGKIENDRQAVSDRVKSIVSGSNSAEGEKAAQQAHNHLLSVMSIEQSKLSALRSLRARLSEEAKARNQSREALIKKYNEQAVESAKVLTGE